jgi:hypothetical protein
MHDNRSLHVPRNYPPSLTLHVRFSFSTVYWRKRRFALPPFLCKIAGYFLCCLLPRKRDARFRTISQRMSHEELSLMHICTLFPKFYLTLPNLLDFEAKNRLPLRASRLTLVFSLRGSMLNVRCSVVCSALLCGEKKGNAPARSVCSLSMYSAGCTTQVPSVCGACMGGQVAPRTFEATSLCDGCVAERR